jgi:putative membrane protein
MLFATVVNWESVAASLVFSLIGLAVFVLGFWVLRKLLPFDVHKELEHDQNTAVGLVIASFVLGLAIIIAAAIHG